MGSTFQAITGIETDLRKLLQNRPPLSRVPQ